MSDDGDESVNQPERHLKPVTKDGFDPFNFEATTYDPNEFYVRSVDKRGHKETVHVPMPPDVYAEVHEMASRSEFPLYRTVQDFMRDAAIHRMHYLAHEYGATDQVKEFIQLEMAKARVETRRRARDTVIDLHGELAAALDYYFKAKDGPNLARSIADCYELAEMTTEPYASKFTELAKEYEKR